MPASKKIIVSLLAITHCLSYCFAQQPVVYSPLQEESTRQKEWSDAAEKKYKQDLNALPSKNRKYYEELYKERYDYLKALYTGKKIITAPEATAYLQSLATEVIKHNPALQSLHYHIVFSKTHWPNASSIGEGSIIFNIGLFNRLQNESQAIFVICHELAHLYLDHSNKSIDRYVSTVYSKEFQRELKTIKKSEYQQGQQLESLVKNLAFRNRRHSREHETQADSLAVEWMKQTSFRVEEALTCLALLDSVDEDKYNVSPPLEKTFHFKEYPFNPKWVREEKGLFSQLAAASKAEQKKEKDSLKTHPDCSLRISRLTPAVQQYRNNSNRLSPVNETYFRQLQSIFDYEIIEHCYQSDNVSRSLYYSLQMLASYPGDPYLIANTGRCLNRLYSAQKDHTLSKITDLPSPFNDPKYDKLLQCIQHLRLANIAAFSYYYLTAHEKTMIHYEDFLEALIRSKEHFNKPEEKQTWVNFYKKQFPKGKYTF